MPPLYHSDSKLSVSTSIELAKDGGHVSYELDHDNETVTFSFGLYQDLMLELSLESRVFKFGRGVCLVGLGGWLRSVISSVG